MPSAIRKVAGTFPPKCGPLGQPMRPFPFENAAYCITLPFQMQQAKLTFQRDPNAAADGSAGRLARMLAHPSGSAFAESALRNAFAFLRRIHHHAGNLLLWNGLTRLKGRDECRHDLQGIAHDAATKTKLEDWGIGGLGDWGHCQPSYSGRFRSHKGTKAIPLGVANTKPPICVHKTPDLCTQYPRLVSATRRVRATLLWGDGRSALPIGGSVPPPVWKRLRWCR